MYIYIYVIYICPYTHICEWTYVHDIYGNKKRCTGNNSNLLNYMAPIWVIYGLYMVPYMVYIWYHIWAIYGTIYGPYMVPYMVHMWHHVAIYGTIYRNIWDHDVPYMVPYMGHIWYHI